LPIEIDHWRSIARECVEIDRFANADRNQRRADDPSDLSRPWHSNTFQVMLTCSDSMAAFVSVSPR
jgi:hypothetical protein